jgi:hypothetical protein
MVILLIIFVLSPSRNRDLEPGQTMLSAPPPACLNNVR